MPLIPPALSLPPDQWKDCAQCAAAYAAALADPTLQIEPTRQLKTDARAWLHTELGKVTSQGYWPSFTSTESLLDESTTAFQRRPQNGATRLIPITNLYNDQPHPIWTPLENLLFRFIHDYHHAQIEADATFYGERSVTRFILTELGETNTPPFHWSGGRLIAHFLASEPLGQSAYFIQTGIYPRQIIAANILPLI